MNGTFGEWVKLLWHVGRKAEVYSIKRRPDDILLNLRSGIGVCVRKYPSSDMKVLRQVWAEQEYSAVVGAACAIFSMQDPIRIVDAGANVGYTSLYLKHKFPCSSIIALEPAEINYQQFMFHIESNNLSNVNVYKEALWRVPAKLGFRQDLKTGDEWAFSVEERPDGEVSGTSISELMKRANWDRIDILKMDIEGAEQYLFDEPYVSTWLSCIRILAIEIHPVPGLEERILDTFNAHGFSYFRHGELVIASSKD